MNEHSITLQIQRLGRQANTTAREVVDHGFQLGLLLIAVLLAGLVVVGLLYTFLAQKFRQQHPPAK